VEIDTLINAISGTTQIWDVAISDGYAYLSDEYTPGGTGFAVVDIDPLSPDYLTSYSAINTTGEDRAIDVAGTYVFLASTDETHSVRLLDASDPTSMTASSIVDSIGWTGADPTRLIIRDKYVYVADETNGLIIIDALSSE